VKHDYFIEDLGRPRGWFKAHHYRYCCLRCGWLFLVEGRARVQPLGERGELLWGPEAVARVQTFVDGPCAAADAPAIPAPGAHSTPEKRPRPAVGRRRDGIPESSRQSRAR
jgi:hypothetical protein